MGTEGEKKSKILVIGGTGRIGNLMVRESIKVGHPTSILVRPSTAAVDPAKAELITAFKNLGATILYGDICDHESLVKAIKQVDVVICTVGFNTSEELGLQFKIVDAIEEAANIKRFIPSEYGNDAEKVNLVEPAKSWTASKIPLRQAIREKAIPHTFVCSFFMHGFFLPKLGQADAPSDTPPTDTVSIVGHGNTKAIYTSEYDVAKYTVRCVDDPLALNKIMYVRPPANVYTLNELVSLWERISGHSLKRVYITEDQLLKKIQESEFPLNFQLAIAHSAFINGEQTNFEIDAAVSVEATHLYPDIKYVTVEDFLTDFVHGGRTSSTIFLGGGPN